MSLVDKGYLCSVVHVLYTIITVLRNVFCESQYPKIWHVDTFAKAVPISLEGHLALQQQPLLRMMTHDK